MYTKIFNIDLIWPEHLFPYGLFPLGEIVNMLIFSAENIIRKVFKKKKMQYQIYM